MFVFENVPGLASMDGGKVIRQICDDLTASGYNVRWDILDAADYGVPQRRKRIFFIGQRLDVMAVDAAKPKRVPRLHLAAIQGRVQYLEWFMARYPQRLPLKI
jgi:site-specific DNA-cytosine methylase